METTASAPSVLVDNRDATLNAIVKFILDKGPEGLRGHDRKFLENLASDPKDTRLFFNVEWQRDEETFRANASLYVTFDENWSSLFEDAEGNVWREYSLVVTTNWSSFGGSAPAIQLKRLALAVFVTSFAQDILDLFPGPFHRMVKTAAQAKAEKEAREGQETIERVKTLVFSNRTKMRVGQERELDLVSDDVFKGLPKASWEVEMADNKRYKFEKTGTHAAYLTRLS